MVFRLKRPSFAPLLAIVYRAWIGSLRFSVRNKEPAETLMRANQPVIFAIWHHDLFALVGWARLVRGYSLAGIVSQSRDGEFAAGVMERIGYVVLRGSSSRGGARALAGALSRLRRQGASLAVTVDGPRGPRRAVKDGVIFLAQATGAPIVPVRAFASHQHVFETSWDRFRLPWPFARVEVIMGEPYRPTLPELQTAHLAREKALLAKRLNDIRPTLPQGSDAPL